MHSFGCPKLCESNGHSQSPVCGFLTHMCHTTDIVSCDTQQTLSAEQTLSAVSHSRHCLLCHCCVTQQGISAVSRIIWPSVTWLWPFGAHAVIGGITWLSWVTRMVFVWRGICQTMRVTHDSQVIAGKGGLSASWVCILGKLHKSFSG